jgi:hypothetical protein
VCTLSLVSNAVLHFGSGCSHIVVDHVVMVVSILAIEIGSPDGADDLLFNEVRIEGAPRPEWQLLAPIGVSIAPPATNIIFQGLVIIGASIG